MLNLRRPVTKKKTRDEIDTLIKDEGLTRLTPALIQELERLVPLKQGRIFKRIGWDCTETRTELMKLFLDKVLSLKIVQMELRRRKKMKHV
jgi:hypothetical protein